jgi:hypothetical protein
MVLYRAPKSQGHPETTPAKKGKKKKWGFIGGDTSTSRRRLRLQPLDVFTPTPVKVRVGGRPTGIFWIFKQKSRQHKTIIPIPWAEPAPPAPVSIAAETPALKALFSSFDRRLQSLAHNPVYPPTPPGFFAGQWPASLTLRPFETEFTRDLRQLPELDRYAVTPPGFRWPRPPMPTLTASFARQLQVLAHNEEYPPTPPAFFEGFFPAPFRVKRIPLTYGREAQVPLELDERPATPLGFFAGQWPSHKPPPIFTTAFARRLQKLPELDRFKPPPVSDENYAGYTPTLKFSWSANRDLITVLNPHVYPATPPGFRWPKPPPVAFKVSFDRSLQTLPQLDQWAPTPPAFFEGFFPAPFRVKRIPTTYGREAQRVLNPHVYPETPAGFFDGFYPGSKRVESLSWSFHRQIQSLELNVYPETPVSAEDYPGLTPVLKANRVEFKRQIQTVQLDERPPTPPGFFEGFFPAPIRLKRIPSAYHRASIVPLELDERPATPPGFFEGHWPAPVPPPTLKTAFARRLQILAIPPVYPVTPVSAEDYPALTPVLSSKRIEFNRKLQALELNEYPETPPGFFEGFFPAPVRLKRIPSTYGREAQVPLELNEYPPTPPGFRWPKPPPLVLKVSFERKLQLPLEINEYPLPPVSAEDYAGYTPAKSIRRNELNRTLQTLGDPHVYPPTPPGFFEGFFPASGRVTALLAMFARALQALPQLDERPKTPTPLTAYTPVLKSNRVEYTRIRRELAQNAAYPPTPAGYFAGFFPGSGRVNASLIEFARAIQALPQHDEWPQIPPVPALTAWTRATDSNKSEFQRDLKAPLELNERPKTPPSIIEGMAMWPAVPIYRRDITRSLQPVWDPSAVIGKPVFVPHDDDCRKWDAECAPTVWTADCTYTTWEAEPICD